VDIRTKLVFALVSVALASMLALGLAMYGGVARQIEARTLDQLTGLAAFKVESLDGIVNGWRDRVSLLASGTHLSDGLRAYARTRDPAVAEGIRRALTDARAAAPVFVQLRVHDTSGRRLALAGDEAEPTPAVVEAGARDASGRPRFEGVHFPPDGGLPTVTFSAPLTVGDETVGYLHAVLSTEHVAELSANYQGLGATGETMVVARDGVVARVLHPVRLARATDDEEPDRRQGSAVGDEVDTAAGRSGMRISTPGPALSALDGSRRPYAGEVVDYRGQEVWAVTDFLPGLDWGVVVKVDAAEMRQPIVDFRLDLVRLAVTLAAFAILFGTVLGVRFAQPIHVLAEAANRIREGDLDARAGIQREDEVGLLARTFDGMADEMKRQVELLTEFRRFFDVSIDMMCIASTDGYFKRVNHAFVRELGWSTDELLARSFLSFVHPDDVEATTAEIEKLAAGRPTIRFENRFLCMDGSYKRLLWNTYPEQDTGCLFAIARVRGPSSEEA